MCLGCLYRHALFDLELADLSESHFSTPLDRAAVALDRAGFCFLSITHISEQRFVNLQVSGSNESDVSAPLDRRVIVWDLAGLCFVSIAHFSEQMFAHLELAGSSDSITRGRVGIWS